MLNVTLEDSSENKNEKKWSLGEEKGTLDVDNVEREIGFLEVWN